ncbi:hypothetical protein [Emcibacter sp.]|uniref:phage tail tape measure protein n=1 Tax=Emcibacter sp. TaxID=1979954 RepID=UPI002AA63CB6|nr:hypothetical protein [Emcibacter sp.]
MTETILDSLVVKLRADSSGLKDTLGDLHKDLGTLDRATVTVTGQMSRAFTDFVHTGELSFESLRKTALSVMDDILGNILSAGLGGMTGGAYSGGALSLGSLVSSMFFGREGGGTVASGRPYLVGEKGPEVFMPHTPGRIVSDPGGRGGASAGRVTNITINVAGGKETPQVGRKSAGQIAVAVQRALAKAERNL